VDSEGRSEAIEGTCAVPEGRGDRSGNKLSDMGESGSSLAQADNQGNISGLIPVSSKNTDGEQ